MTKPWLLVIGAILASAGAWSDLLHLPVQADMALGFVGILCMIAGLPNSAAVGAAKSNAAKQKQFWVFIAAIAGGAFLSYFGIRHSSPQVGRPLTLLSAVAGFATCGAIAYWASRRTSGQRPLLLRRRGWLMLVACLLFVASEAYTYLEAGNDACRSVDREIGAASRDLSTGPRTTARAAEFARRLASIDTKDVPPDVTAALAAYIAAFERSVTEFQITGRSGLADKEVESRKKVFVEAIGRCK